MANVKNVAPGIGLCAAIAIPCWFLGEALPVVGGPVFAILIGMVIALWWKQPARGTVQDGIAFTAKKVLQYAVILLGFGLNLAQIAAVGAESLPIILTTIATALIVGYILYRVLSVDSAIATLIAVGSSICGGSAIAATAPVITMALSPLLFKEHLRLPVVVGFAIVVGGLLLLNASALEGTLSCELVPARHCQLW